MPLTKQVRTLLARMAFTMITLTTAAITNIRTTILMLTVMNLTSITAMRPATRRKSPLALSW